jgi:MarR family transcriptional regulator, temperature-dependent positive regulator of motility
LTSVFRRRPAFAADNWDFVFQMRQRQVPIGTVDAHDAAAAEPVNPVTDMLENSSLGEIWVLCFVANRFIGPMYRAIEEEADISRPEFVVLLCAGHRPGIVAQDVADMSGLPRNSVSRGVNRLLANGFLARAPGRGGLRDKVLQLTPAGQELRARLIRHPAERRLRMLDAITSRERQTLERLLLKLALAAPRWAGQPEP